MEKYEAIEQIGEGSFGKVFRAKRIEDNVFVALKFVPKLGRSEREINSLRQECEIQKNLIHSNIIHMLDSFETDKFVVVVTEYAARGELSSLLEKDRRLSTSKVQTIAVDLVSALNYLHSRRILHRDMKPQNILIGSDGFYKLCDFGFARTMGIDTYMLTSIKGTPLYMAPEIIEEKPYDHNADLWSLGCILYELLVGKPPFFTKSLFQLVTMIRNDSIVYPDFIAGDCLSFLKGLLEKVPQKRLTWPQLLIHPFVRDGVRVENSSGEFSLTKALSPSQELAKESQRQHLQKKLTGYSKLLIKTARKLEDAQRKLEQYGGDGKPILVKTPRSSPGQGKIPAKSSSSGKSPKIGPQGSQPDQQQPEQIAKTLNQNDVKEVTVLLNNISLEEKPPLAEEKGEKDAEGVSDGGSGSSCETLTSSSEDEDESDDDGNTVILGRLKKNRSLEQQQLSSREKLLAEEEAVVSDKNKHGGDAEKRTGADGGSQTLWKSGALFTLHSFGSEDKPLHSEEWLFFLIKTMKEVIETPTSLCEKHFLSIFVGPLRNHLAGPEVVEKIAALFSIPFSSENDINSSQPGLLLSLQTIYLESKVVPNLLYSCKLIVRRRRLERGSVELNEIAAILTAEDLDALDKCLRLVCCLVHLDEDFVNQFCDSVCVLQLFPILQLFLKLDKRKSRLTTDTLAILCHVMRIIPSNASIIDELFLIIGSNGSEESCEEFWRILRHSNPIIKSRALRILSYLAVNSENTRDKIIRKNCAKVWKLLRESSLSMDRTVREAAEFAMLNLKYLSSVKTTCNPVATVASATSISEKQKSEQMNIL